MKFLRRRIILVSLMAISACGKSPDMSASALEGFRGHAEPKTVTRETISELRDDELEQTIVDNIIIDLHDDGGGVTAEKIAKLNKGQRAIYITWIWEAKISKGGLQYFFDHTSGTVTTYLKEAFQTVDAPSYSEIMEQANAIMKSIQDGQIKVKPDSYPFSDLDEAIERLKGVESLDAIKVRYIRNHPEEFVHN